jgi:hypothetical protein
MYICETNGLSPGNFTLKGGGGGAEYLLNKFSVRLGRLRTFLWIILGLLSSTLKNNLKCW